MARYFTKHKAKRPTAEWWFDEPMRHIPTVCDHEPTDTGILDKDGNTIWRAPNPIGFVWDITGEQ